MTSFINFDSFSHGQVVSKLWLCEELEKCVSTNARVAILGSWYNLLSFMLLTRRNDLYQFMLGIDIDSAATEVSERICDAWRFGCDKKVSNITADAGKFNYDGFNVVINCSVEHMANDWFDKIPSNTLVCIQSSDVTIQEYPWLIANPNPTIETLIKKYPLSRTLFSGEKEINYSDWGYKRFMLIGVK